MRSWGLACLALLLFALFACGSKGSGGAQPAADAGDDSEDPQDFAAITHSCAYSCPDVTTCPESNTPYDCQNTGAWGTIPHADACGAWDGGAPAAQQGQCTATAATGEAAKYGGPDPDHAGTVVLPDGRRIAPAGSDWVFDESDLQGGLTTYVG
ncbi:MAG: hypothetical protein ACRELB_08995, partial [Polyangiaceae bacterium]